MQAAEVTQDQFLAVRGYKPSYFKYCGGTCSVEDLNWHEAVAFCNSLSSKAGLTLCYSCSGSGDNVKCKETSATAGKGIYSCKGYRLPTEAEFEYAYRAGTTTAYYSGQNVSSLCYSCSSKDANADIIAWYCYNAGYSTHPIGKKLFNAWGLFDMAGNVSEWCHDWYQKDLGSSAVTDPVGAASTSDRVTRGGSYFYQSQSLRAAFRLLGQYHMQRFSYVGFRCARTK